jgi:hypothetical protein
MRHENTTGPAPPGTTRHEASVVEHDGPPPGLSAVVAVDDYLHAGQVAEVLDDDARLGR